MHSHYTDQYLALFIFRLFFDLGFIAQGQSFRLTLFMVLIINACKTFWIEDIKEELFKLFITLSDPMKYSSPKKNVRLRFFTSWNAWRNGYLSADHYLSVYSLPFGFFTLGLKLPPSERQLSRQLRLIRSIDEQVPPHRSGIILWRVRVSIPETPQGVEQELHWDQELSWQFTDRL